MPKEIFEVVRERFHLSDRTQYIVQGHWPKDAVMEAYLDQHKLKVSVKENENVSALERFKDPEKMQEYRLRQLFRYRKIWRYHKLVIYEKFSDKKHVWFSITAGELDKKRDKPQVYFEEESAEQGTVRIRGWAIAPKPVTVRIFDADKSRLPLKSREQTGWMSTSCLKKHRIRERQDSSLRSPTFRENACM